MGHWPTREGMLQQVITAQVMFHTEKKWNIKSKWEAIGPMQDTNPMHPNPCHPIALFPCHYLAFSIMQSQLHSVHSVILFYTQLYHIMLKFYNEADFIRKYISRSVLLAIAHISDPLVGYRRRHTTLPTLPSFQQIQDTQVCLLFSVMLLHNNLSFC